MEDGSDGLSATATLREPLRNGEVMAKLPEVEEPKDVLIKVNGNTSLNDAKSDESDESSDYDALVIDESVNTKKKQKRRKRGFRGFKNTNENDYMHSNPYFKESIFELFEKSQDKRKEARDGDKIKNHKPTVEKKGKANPKLREYTQYLGLQPTVQFKCKKCLRSGFPSWGSLNDHILQCNQTTPVNNSTSTSNISGQTNIRVTRNVFLCSACGTYYENWNLFLHMREVHRRYICLYCLGMFSHPEKLSMHIISKHNCIPNRINSLEEFYNIYKVPCFLMCCECQKGFTESDNFFEHQCLEVNSNKLTAKSLVKNPKNSKPISHITGDSNLQAPTPLENENNLTENIDENTYNEDERNDNCDTLIDSVTQNSVDFDVNESKSVQDFKTTETQEPCDINLTDANNFDDSTMPQEDDPVQNNRIENDRITQDSQDSNTAEQSPKPNLTEDKPNTDDETPETRKVPKVTLKLPKSFEYQQKEEVENYESDDSEKLTMEVDQIENESQESNTNLEMENQHQNQETQIQVAGPDVPIIELELEQPLDKFDIKVLLQKCLGLTIATCVYCNHARKISVNGKQLGLHAIAEHRFSAVVNSITAEELIPESFVSRIKDSLVDLENVYFNLESNSSEAVTFSHVFECFQCRYSTTIHKELYLHNRKMHAKSILLCIMCKSNFYSYSELICHLCPGLYELNSNIHFRCCMCVSDELPSAFRLMVHLRKKHHACDVCLELCHNQSKLSNHVWKHKLHHLCYRCGIAYRNKPDITKHLFWKHGTESVLCKKCLQKKWPHVYHFCIPPLSFICEDCNLSFSRAVYLMVHKRLHNDFKPHICAEESCGERFISKKLLLKHEFKHREPQEDPAQAEVEKIQNPEISQMETENPESVNGAIETSENEEKEKPKPKIDVYDLPELNLSESDSSDSEDESKTKGNFINSAENTENNDLDANQGEKPPPVLETIWDDFRNYQANKDKQEHEIKPEEVEEKINLEVILNDHDYCVVPEKPDNELREADMSADHDYCTGPKTDNGQTASSKSPKKKQDGSSTSDSSDSDSSSCTCGSNCSCSSSSGSSSSSTDSSESDSSSSEGRRRQEARRERRKQKASKKTESESAPVDVVNDNQPIVIPDIPIQESDLETTESDTDEDFYDKQPQELANKLLAEKKNQLLQMASIGPYINGSIMDGSRPPTPSLPEEPKKKKSKSKKKKKKNKSSKYESENPNVVIPNNYQSIAPLTLTLPKNSPTITPSYNSPDPVLNLPTPSQVLPEADTNLRASKRRRVPNKFYGYSSDEETPEKVQTPVHKWRKMDLPSPRSPMVVPPITIKALPIPEPSRITNDFRHHIKPFRPPGIPKVKPPQVPEQESATDSNDTSSDDEPPSAPPQLAQPQPALYCYCRCPYDEVSEMIGCDSSDCAIEWFHFECVGIMVPPKGQWFCPDCRKKKQQRRELLQGHMM